MKLLTKISLSAIVVIALAMIGGGYSLIELNFKNELQRTASDLDIAAKRIDASNNSLSSALVVADETDTPLTIAFLDMDGYLTTIVESSVQLDVAPPTATIDLAKSEAVLVDAKNEYQLRTVELSENEFMLIATSTQTAQRTRDGNLLTLALVSIFTIVIAGGAVTILIRRDLKSVIATLAGTASQERETRESMQTFMGDASHELRTPLTVIKGYAELLAASEAKTSADQREKAYARIVEQVNRMDETITSLLQLAEVGSISSNSYEAVDLKTLVTAAVDDLQALNPRRKIEADLADVEVLGSAELLGRLLNNAIGNINRHTGETDKVRVSLTTERKQAVLIIEDGGPGLPEEAYSKGIQGFRRFDESRSRETGGTGLGMTIMNSIVQAHSGEMSISKSELGGLKLEIKLPLN
jgi:signal transduction histidine kinase